MCNIKYFLIVLFIFTAQFFNKSYAKPIIVAVVDTGFDFNSNWSDKQRDSEGRVVTKPKLCASGHKDFTNTGIEDTSGHGTHVAGIIGKFAENSNYCLVIIKVYDKKIKKNQMDITNKGISYAIDIQVDIINYSMGGEGFDLGEYLTFKKALSKGIIVVAAAGNDKMKLNHYILKVGVSKAARSVNLYFIHHKTSQVTTKKPSVYYPAAYDPRIISVANITNLGNLNPKSNYGDIVLHKEIGTHVYSILPNNSYGYMTGTSMSAPTKTGKIIKLWNK